MVEEENSVDKMEGQDEMEIVEEVVSEGKYESGSTGESKSLSPEVVGDTEKEDKGEGDSKKPEGLYEEIALAEGISASVDGHKLMMKKGDNEIVREIHPFIEVKVESDRVVLSCDRERKIERKLFGTNKAHVRNMVKGLSEGFVYKLKVANVHFPMKVSYNKDSNEVVVNNFLGEKVDRKIKLVDGVEVSVKGEDIEISSANIESAGNAAAQIEKGTKVRNKDRRIYQDGIFITEKPGRVFG
jgi:large subunit ribosomal protein L6|tara:strand:+ start:206 stop:931 length:726 start_codon:yes stop_codon:yes gene_type:complete